MALLDILNSGFLQSALKTLNTQARPTASSSADAGANAPAGWSDVLSAGGKAPDNWSGLLSAGAVGALLGNVIPGGARTAALVGLSAVAWNFYQKWSSTAQRDAEPQTSALLQSSMTMPFDATSEMVLRVMVYAARADGRIDEAERQRMDAVMKHMVQGRDVSALLHQLQQEELDPSVFASQIQSAEQGEDIYRLSLVVIDVDTFMERSYMDALAKILNITGGRRKELEAEACEARRQLTQAVSA